MCPFNDWRGYCFRYLKYCDECDNTECKHLECIVDSFYDFYSNHCSDKSKKKIVSSCLEAIVRYCGHSPKYYDEMVKNFYDLCSDEEREHNLRYGFGCLLMLNLFKDS